MDFKKVKIEQSAITRNLNELDVVTNNIYETIVIFSKRANQIAAEIKDELHQKLSEFSRSNDSLEEIFENREQIDIARYYENMPKPTLIAINEFLSGNTYFKNPDKELGAF